MEFLDDRAVGVQAIGLFETDTFYTFNSLDVYFIYLNILCTTYGTCRKRKDSVYEFV